MRERLHAWPVSRAVNRHARCFEKTVPIHVEANTSMAVCEPLSKDHERIEELLEALLAAFDAGDDRATEHAWTALNVALLAHLKAEETYLIPFLERASPRSARVVTQEHRHLRARLTELGGSLSSERSGRANARAFVDELRAHARSEERLLYQWADAHLDSTQKALLIEALRPRAGRTP